MPRDWIRLAAAGFLALVIAGASPSLCRADNSPSTNAPSATPSMQPPPAPQAQTPAPASTPQPPAASGPTPPSGAETSKPPEAAAGSTGETVELAQRPFAYVEGKADRDEVYSAIQGSLGLAKRDLDKAGLKPSGRPLAVFIESDDTGFRYRAGYPLEAAPDSKPGLSDAVKIGATPSGKAMRFQHLGAYADIDATYDAITAYLDEKGVDAQDSFVEEYANDVKDVDDPNLEVDIYVLLK